MFLSVPVWTPYPTCLRIQGKIDLETLNSNTEAEIVEVLSEQTSVPLLVTSVHPPFPHIFHIRALSPKPDIPPLTSKGMPSTSPANEWVKFQANK